MPPSSLKTSPLRPPIRLTRSPPPASLPTPPPPLDAAAAAAAPMAKLPPAPSWVALLDILCLLVVLAAAAAPLALARGSPGAGTIHELLRSHGLPGGLLPRGVESYTLDEGNGLLEARLSAPCYAMYNDDLAFFDTVVRGNLSFGALRSVEGLAQEELFMWLPVKGILVTDPRSGVILFDIGYAHKSLPRSLFEEPPDCKPSAATGMGAAEAARWKDSKGLPGLRFRAEAGGEGHQDQR